MKHAKDNGEKSKASKGNGSKKRKPKKRDLSMDFVVDSLATVQQQSNQDQPLNDIDTATGEPQTINSQQNTPGKYVRLLQNESELLRPNGQPYNMQPRSAKGFAVASFFTDFTQMNSTKAQAVCKLCSDLNGNRCTISFKKGVNSNLIRHLQRRHLDVYNETMIKLDHEHVEKIKNLTLTNVKKKKIIDSILKFIIKERLAIVKMNSTHFNELIATCLGGNVTYDKQQPFCSAYRGKKRIQELAIEQRDKIKSLLQNLDYLSATSDVWTRSNVSFLAVTIHYIDKTTLQPHSYLIACEHFPGRHTKSAVATKLHSIFKKYNIVEKVYFITTDSEAANVYGIQDHGNQYNAMNDLDDDLPFFADEYEAEQAQNGDEYMDENMLIGDDNEVLAEESRAEFTVRDALDFENDDNIPDASAAPVLLESTDDFVPDRPLGQLLPNLNRIACSSHLLEKIIRRDTLKITDQAYLDMRNQVFAKMQAIWNLQKKRTLAERFKTITNRKIVGPHHIRWLSEYSAIEFIKSIPKDLMKVACEACDIDALNHDDYDFITEYTECAGIIADALRLLEGQKHSFALYLPVLFGVRTALCEIGSLEYCKPLLDSIIKGFNDRLDNHMNIRLALSRPLFMAMASHPRYKFDYMRANRVSLLIYSNVEKFLYNECEKMFMSRIDQRDQVQEPTKPMSIASQDNLTQPQPQPNDVEMVTAGPSHSDSADDPLHSNETPSNCGRLSKLLVATDVSHSLKKIALQNRNQMISGQITEYLNTPRIQGTDDDVVAHLNNYPLVKEVFLKYNCIKTSEAICERIFSYAGWSFFVRQFESGCDVFVSLTINMDGVGRFFGFGILFFNSEKRLNHQIFKDELACLKTLEHSSWKRDLKWFIVLKIKLYQCTIFTVRVNTI